MKLHSSAITRTALPAIVLSASVASAMPFKMRDAVVGSNSSMRGSIAIQSAPSLELEIYTGGSRVLKNFQASSSPATLPDFNLTPYGPGFPVTWHNLCGDAGDIDGDGDMDIVRSGIMGYNGNIENRPRMIACLNTNGVFGAGWQFFDNTTPDGGPIPVKLADLDRDGDLDLVEGLKGIAVRWNDGTGAFSAPTTLYSAVVSWDSIVCADFDHDGWTDIAALDGAYSGKIYLLTSNAGSYTATTLTTMATDHKGAQLEMADIDRDGREDLVYWDHFNAGSNTPGSFGAIRWMRNNNAGFDAPATIVTTGSDRFMGGFAFGDVDEDGDSDLAFTDFPPTLANGALRLCVHGAGSSFSAPVVLGDSPGGGISTTEVDSVLIADCDRDGDSDIVVGFGRRMFENTAIHREAGVFASTWAGTSPDGAARLAVADINGDGRDDLIAACTAEKKMLWYPGGTSTLAAPISVSTGNRAPTSLAAADFDRDGDMDIAYATTGEIRRLLSFNGAGTTWNEGLLATMSGVTEITVGDMEQDGDADVLAASPAAGNVRWHKNDGQASLWSLENAATGLTGVKALTVGQMNPGGRLEVAALTLNGGSPAFREYQHNGAGWASVGNFQLSTADDYCAVHYADYRRDHPGMEGICSSGGSIFLPQTSTTVGNLNGSIRSLKAIDWNHDQRTDILCAWSGGVLVYLSGNESGTLWTPHHLISRTSCVDAVAIDLNHDEAMDAAAVKEDGTLILLFNAGHHLSVTQTALHPAGGAVKIGAGATAPVLSLNVTNHGSDLQNLQSDFIDASAAPSQVVLRFYKAVASGGSYTAGAAMTAAEIQQAVESVNIEGVAVTTPAALSGSSLIIPISAADRASLGTAANSTRTLTIRVKLKPTAANATYDRLFVEHVASTLGASTQWLASESENPAFTTPLDADSDVSSRMALVEIDALTQIEQWRQLHFGAPDGTGVRANDADFDKDGVPNLAEYVTGTNPTLAQGDINAANGIFLFDLIPGQSPQFRLRLSDEAMSNPKVRITVQQTDSLKTWGTTTTRTGGGSWTGLAPYNSIPLGGGLTSYLFNVTSIQSHLIPKFFLRLKVEELP